MDFCDEYYADDVILAMAHSRREALLTEARAESVASREVLAERGLDATREKSADMFLSPDGTINGFFRRAPNGHQAASMDLKKKEKAIGAVGYNSSEEEGTDPSMSGNSMSYSEGEGTDRFTDKDTRSHF